MSLGPLGYAMVLINSLSAALIVLAGSILYGAVRSNGRGSVPTCFLIAVLVCELALFIFSGFDLTPTDPYSAGYRGLAIPLLMAALIVIGWLFDSAETPLWIGLAALLYILRVYDTPNLWDYLVDPLSGLVALVWLAGALALRLTRGRSS